MLIDSHVLIWLLYEPEKIGSGSAKSLKSAEKVFVSPVSLWELTLKFTKGKLTYSPQELSQGIEALNLNRLALLDRHILALPNIELVHSDPFDRLLIAQAKIENIPLITADELLLKSSYQTIDCRL